MFKFKVGDKVRIKKNYHINPKHVGTEGVVTRLGGVATTDQGTVVTADTLPTGATSYGEHGYWFDDKFLELVEEEATE